MSKSGTMFQNYVEEKDGIPLLTSKDHKLNATFEISSSNTAIANTLRRQILVATPSIGFKTEPALESDVKITINTSSIPNPMISHSIGMLPIAGDPATFDPSKYIFQLNVKNETDSTMDVTASDIIVIEKDSATAIDGIRRPTEEFFPPDPITGQTCIITRLRPQWNPSSAPETIAFTATASIETGSKNIRWSPVSQCSYENTLDPDPKRQKEMFERWLKESKKIEEGGEAVLLDRLRKEFDTMEVKRCFKVNELGEPNHFTFHLESIGMQPIPMIVMNGIMACKALVDKYKDIDTMIPANVSFRKSDTRYSAIDCIFRNEGHTLGNLLQTYLTYNHMEGSKEPRIAYAGYKIPHPLRPELIILVAVPPSEEEAKSTETEIGLVRYAIAQVCRSLVDFFHEMAKDWSGVTGYPIPKETSAVSKEVVAAVAVPKELVPNVPAAAPAAPAAVPKEAVPAAVSKEVVPAAAPAAVPKEVVPAAAPAAVPKEAIPAAVPKEAVPAAVPKEVVPAAVSKEAETVNISPTLSIKKAPKKAIKESSVPK